MFASEEERKVGEPNTLSYNLLHSYCVDKVLEEFLVQVPELNHKDNRNEVHCPVGDVFKVKRSVGTPAKSCNYLQYLMVEILLLFVFSQKRLLCYVFHMPSV